MSDHLLRQRAPITDGGWKLIDDEARERLLPGLASRRLVDFRGPHGWEFSATNLGRVERGNVSEQKGVEANRRMVLPLIELRSRFSVSREELRAGDRGARDIDFESLDAAAQRIVDAENTAVFHAWPKAGIEGIAASSPHKPIVRDKSFESYPGCVARATELLLRSGIAGPYGLALGRFRWAEIVWQQAPNRPDLLDAFREAAEHAQKAAEIRPDFGQAYLFWGLSLKYLGKTAEAAGPLKKGVAARPENMQLQRALGEVLMDLGQMKEAEARLENARRLDPNDQGVIQDLEKLHQKKD